STSRTFSWMTPTIDRSVRLLRELRHGALMHELAEQMPFVAGSLPDETVIHRFPAVAKILRASQENESVVADHFNVVDRRFFRWNGLSLTAGEEAHCIHEPEHLVSREFRHASFVGHPYAEK